jgi:beta-phosphoglucomutase-like phosphatase (HAD superfamily)
MYNVLGGTMGKDTERLVAEIPRELKMLVDADRRTNKEVVEAALWTELGGQKQAAIERRIEEKKRTKTNLETQRNEREREIEELKEEIGGLEELLEETLSQREQQRIQAIRQVELTSLASVDEPIIETSEDELQELAEGADMTVTELKTEAKRRFNNE